MKLLVTGAAGFIGSCVVERLLDMGHTVRAQVRSDKQRATLPWHNHHGVEFRYEGFHEQKDCRRLLDGIEGVIHLAATRSKSWEEQKKRTVEDTQILVDISIEQKIRHFILIGSYSVYDYTNIPRGSNVDEASPLINESKDNGAYPWAKLQQEKIIVDACVDRRMIYTIIRLGAVYGPGAAWTHRLGLIKGRVWIRFGSSAKVPLVYIHNAADAIALAAVSSGNENKILNVVDDDCPTQRQYMIELMHFWKPRPIAVLPVNFRMLRGLSIIIWKIARYFKQQYRVPLTIRPMCLDAMAKPMNYPNDGIKQKLGWKPRIARVEALKYIFGAIE